MRHALWVGALAAVVIPVPARAADGPAIDDAIARGVKAVQGLQQRDGSWSHGGAENTTGATALAAVTLLECGVDKGDPGLVNATRFIRNQVPGLRQTYSIALSIIFLDRLGESADVPLIESLAARLVAGQDPSSGAWWYWCPEPVAAEQARLRAIAGGQGTGDARTLVAGQAAGDEQRARSGKPAAGAAQSFAQRMATLNARAAGRGSDNSNTQFAILALWVARRHGFPVDTALKGAELHFRNSQDANDGGWSYSGSMRGMGVSTPTMTCAGLLGLAAGTGVRIDQAEKAREKSGHGDRGKAAHDPNKDIPLKAALHCLALSIGNPIAQPVGAGVPPAGRPGGRPPRGAGGGGALGFGGGQPLGGLNFPQGGGTDVAGRSYYFLWSLERVAAILNMDTIGKKDWYGWGSDVIVAAQQNDGTWKGSYAQGGVDTCFALLFLKKANFAKDLSKLMGRVEDGGTRSLKSGGLGGGSLAPPKEEGMRKNGEDADSAQAPVRVSNKRTRPKSLGDTYEAKIAENLLDLPEGKQAAEIDRLGGQKGAPNTLALAMAIPYLSGDNHRKAREALAEREARMKATVLARDLHDDDPEIRRAAALACAMKDAKQLAPELIGLLADRHQSVARAAHDALKALSGQDFGPSSDASEAAVSQAADEWRAWWKKQGQ
jgi:hypothetical protein